MVGSAGTICKPHRQDAAVAAEFARRRRRPNRMRPTVRLIPFDGDPYDTEDLEHHRRVFLYANRPYNLPTTYAVTACTGIALIFIAQDGGDTHASSHYRTIVTVIGSVLIALPLLCAYFVGCGVHSGRHDARD